MSYNYYPNPYPEGPGWSPHGGEFWFKNGKTYWFNGEVFDNPPISRFDPPGGLGHIEDFSSWTDEHRAEVLSGYQKIWEEVENRKAAGLAALETLAEQAKAKLTAEEYNAVLDLGRIEERGYL